jgi:nicotinamide mononucleotide adenylyltransferase
LSSGKKFVYGPGIYSAPDIKVALISAEIGKKIVSTQKFEKQNYQNSKRRRGILDLTQWRRYSLISFAL